MTKVSEKFYTRLAAELAHDLVRIVFSYVKMDGGLDELNRKQKKAYDLMIPELEKVVRLAKRELIIEAEIVPSMISLYNVMKTDCMLTNNRLRKADAA